MKYWNAHFLRKIIRMFSAFIALCGLGCFVYSIYLMSVKRGISIFVFNFLKHIFAYELMILSIFLLVLSSLGILNPRGISNLIINILSIILLIYSISTLIIFSQYFSSIKFILIRY